MNSRMIAIKAQVHFFTYFPSLLTETETKLFSFVLASIFVHGQSDGRGIQAANAVDSLTAVFISAVTSRGGHAAAASAALRFHAGQHRLRQGDEQQK